MKKHKAAFTLIELMVVIALIGVIAIMLSGINFNYMSDRQKSEQFANKILSIIENNRNDFLVGKLDSSGKKELKILTLTKNNGVGYLYENGNYQIYQNTGEIFNLRNINCGNGTPIENVYIVFNNIDEIITSSPLAGSGNNLCKQYKLLTFETSYNNSHIYKIKFDPVTQLVTKTYLGN